ncbi:TetR family transcriptional regulator [Exiguobacterium profundum]|uniref:TetR family transcriptional regulator n=1 Tax=Exiguobacterium profundum TaxID=307643 RepID=UPI00391D7CAC
MELHVETLIKMDGFSIIDADLSGDEVIVLVNQDGPVVNWNERTLRLPFHLSSPFIRLLDSEMFLVVDVTLEETPVNTWVIDERGKVLHSFHAGNAIGAVSVNDTGIWIGYADEGVFGEGISTEALVCFSHTGNMLHCYQSDLIRPPTIVDCELLQANQTGVWLCPSIWYDLIHVDSTGRLNKYKTPKLLHDSSALTVRGQVGYFVKDGLLYRWPFGKRERPHIVTKVSGNARGLAEGERFHFIQIGDYEVNGVQLVDE